VSRELFKHILDGEATGIYQGRVVVAPGAQKTDGKMLSKCIFLGEGANMYNKPELEIFADDVVCGHGATVGALDEDQLFYLRARGIPLHEAQALLLEAFAAEALEAVSVASVKDEMVARVGDWLRQHGR
jgi:Fe-S cluster assembly protein SufD